MNNRITKIIIVQIYVIYLSACTLEPTKNVSYGDFNYPDINTKPTRFFKVKGTTSPTLKHSMTAVYSVPEKTKGCSYLQTNIIEGHIRRAFSVEVPVELMRKGSKFAAEIQVDRFKKKKGSCIWQFTYLKLTTSKGDMVSIPDILLSQPSELWWKQENVAKSKQRYKRNWDESPVILVCDFSIFNKLRKGSKVSACKSPHRRLHGKDQKILTPQRTYIEVNISDAEIN